MLISLVAFTLVYGALAVVEFRLIKRAAQAGPDDAPEIDEESGRPQLVGTVY